MALSIRSRWEASTCSRLSRWLPRGSWWASVTASVSRKQAREAIVGHAHGELVGQGELALDEEAPADVSGGVDPVAPLLDPVDDRRGRLLGGRRAPLEVADQAAHLRVLTVQPGDVDGADQRRVDPAGADQADA